VCIRQLTYGIRTIFLSLASPNLYSKFLGIYPLLTAELKSYLILEIHVAVNIKGKRILSLEVTSEEVYDGKMLDNASKNNCVKGIVADGIYDVR
jgi:hypothetical protein